VIKLFSAEILEILSKAAKLYIAFSGGLDSTVLLYAALKEPQLRSKIYAIHVNHQLNKQACAWQQHCINICQTWAVPCISALAAFDTTHNIEAHARQARYAIFKAQLGANDVLLTGHHLHDQAETLLLQLFRGAGVRGLAAMPSIKSLGQGRVIRPLLHHAQETLEQYALDNRLTWITDTSNKDSYFTRNWLRLDLIPQLQVRWPHVEHTLAKTAMHCQEAQQLLEELAWQDYQAVALDKQLSLLKLQTLSYARLKNVLRYWLNKHDLSPPDTQKLHAMATIFFTAKTDGLPEIIHETSVIRCYQHHLYIVPRARCKPKSQAWVDFPAPLHLTADLGQLTVNSDALVPVNAPDLHIRFRQGGERIYHHSHHKCLKKCLQAWRVPPWERARIPLLYSCDQLLAVIGYMYSDDYPKILGKHTKIMWHKSSNQHSG
tara:strand:- start:1355 stop:2653 length:1299 start_codon:yes stop_codon:yes gene_type:complete